MAPLWPKPITAPVSGSTAFRHPGGRPIRGIAATCRPRSPSLAAARWAARRRTCSRRPASTSRCSNRAASPTRRRAARTGIVVHEPEPFFHELAKQHGVRDARHIYQIARRGSLEYVAALKRLRIECGLQIRDAIHFSSSPDGIQALQKEYSARREAGLDVASLKGTPLFRADRRERLRPRHARQRERRSVQGDDRPCARGRRARRKDLRAVAGHAHSPAAPDGRDQDRRRAS